MHSCTLQLYTIELEEANRLFLGTNHTCTDFKAKPPKFACWGVSMGQEAKWANLKSSIHVLEIMKMYMPYEHNYGQDFDVNFQ